jgi:hypothetical protein
MNVRLKGWNLLRSPGGSTEKRYMRLMHEQGAPAWPLFVTILCIPLGIAVFFGAIVWFNIHRVR